MVPSVAVWAFLCWRIVARRSGSQYPNLRQRTAPDFYGGEAYCLFESEIDAALKKITGKHLVGKAKYGTQVPDSDCRSKCSSYAGRLWAASVQSGKLSHQAVVRKTAPIPVRGGVPSVMQSPPSPLVARVGHLDLPQFDVPIGRGGWTNRRELRSTPTR
jgi:hypothetical protein